MVNSQKVTRENVEDILSLTPLQEGMLFHYLKDPYGEEYFEQLSLNIRGKIEYEYFKEAWKSVVCSNGVLRSIFEWEETKKPVQIILKHIVPDIYFYDLVHSGDIESIRNKDKNNKFNLKNVPFRITLCKLEEEKYTMIMSHHHILFDGWSTGIILKEFFDAYNSIFEGNEVCYKNKTKFKEFVRHIRSLDKDKQKAFWCGHLEGVGSSTRLFLSRKTDRNNYMVEKLSLSKQFSYELNEYAKKCNVTASCFFYAAWAILLKKYSDIDHCIFGTTVSGRVPNISGIEQLVGLLINTVPLRVDVNSDKRISDLIYDISSSLIERKDYECTSLVDIKSYIGLKNELFDTIVVLENYPIDNSLVGEKSSLLIESHHMVEHTNYSLSIGISNHDNIEFSFSFNDSVISREKVLQMKIHLKNILNEILYNTKKKLSEIDMLSDKEKNQLLEEFNNTYREYPNNKTFNELFEKQVCESPYNIAVVSGESRLTYDELNRKANQLAWSLRENGADADDIICVMVERSFEMVVAIVGILKSGAAYLPIFMDSPQERVDFILDDSGAKILVSDKDVSITKKEIKKINIHEVYINQKRSCNLPVVNNVSSSFNMIYTSGSTGKPKGVIIEHKSVINLAYWFGRQYNIGENTRLFQVTDYSFDTSVEDFVNLLFGATLYLASREMLFDQKAFVKYIEDNKINIINCFTGIVKKLLLDVEKIPCLETVICGGESMEEYLKNELLNKGYILYNNYGLTETTVDSHSSKCTYEEVTIGIPIDNVRCYLFDSNRNIVPIGVIGEIYIAGDCLARGYHNDAKLNSERFLENPYKKGERVFRTGDLGRWFPDGKIEFLGRMDNQIKLRGYRIELEEIENYLTGFIGVKEAKVLLVDENVQDSYLCAFIVSDMEIDIKEIKNSLNKVLPGYMIPTRYVRIEKLFYGSNGKVDKKLLYKLIPKDIISSDYVKPETEIEKTIHKIWGSILGLESLGINDDFFSIGGNSLLLIQIYSQLNKAYPKMLSVQDLFDYRTIKELAEIIEKKSDLAEVKVKSAKIIEF